MRLGESELREAPRLERRGEEFLLLDDMIDFGSLMDTRKYFFVGDCE